MKVFYIIFLLVGLCFSQGYDETINWFDLNFFLVEGGTIVETAQNITVTKDTSLSFSWETKEANLVTPFITNAIGSIKRIIKIINTESLWTAGTANVSRDIVLENGLYEITMDLEEMMPNPVTGVLEPKMSGLSWPLYINVIKKKAKLVINLSIP